jgi:FAD-dependent monooxygenase
MNMIFVHIKSRDPRITAQGQFWHMFHLNGAAVVAQDERDTWTWHLMVPGDTDMVDFDAEKAIYAAAGGVFGPCPLNIDEILVKGIWKSKLAVADSFESKMRRVFLAGDAGEWEF